MELCRRIRALACGLLIISFVAGLTQMHAEQPLAHLLPTPPGSPNDSIPAFTIAGDDTKENVTAGPALPFEVRVQQFLDEGRFDDVERMYRSAIGKLEQKLGRDDPSVATGLKNLAFVFQLQGRYSEAVPLYQRALEIRQKSLGENHPQVALALSQLAEIYQVQRRFQEAERMHKQAVQIFENSRGLESLDTGLGYNNLARLYLAERRYNESESLFHRALRIFVRVRGPIHSDVALACNNLALVYQAQGRYADAAAYLRRALVIFRAPGRDNAEVAFTLHNLAAVSAQQRQWAQSLDYTNQAVKIVIDRMRNSAQMVSARAGSPLDTPWNRVLFESYLGTAWERAREMPALQHSLAEQAFNMAQWAGQTAAATALAQMAARQGKVVGALSDLVRLSQDLSGKWSKLDKQLLASLSASTQQTGRDNSQPLRDQLTGIEQHIAEADARLKSEFPEYHSLVRPEPLSFKEVQQQLRPDEVLILLTLTGTGSFVWAVAHDDVRWVKLALDQEEIATRVQRLRCGLDSSNWIDPSRWQEASEGDKWRKQEQSMRRERCKLLTETEVKANAPLPFDLATAHGLYRDLVGPFNDLIAGKKLLIVSAGPLASLPFQVLVTDKPDPGSSEDAGQYAKAAWLAKSHAVSVLPSVSSLSALRQFTKTSKASHPFIGFGNPLLIGWDGSDRTASSRQMCTSEPRAKPVEIAGWEVPESIAKYFRGGPGDVESLRRHPPLPETADELCAVASLLGANIGDVNLGSNATEKRIKSLSGSGDLANYAVVHVATHGLLASETKRIAKVRSEPALILTPPETATEKDDGLLTASEVSQLKLNADWVVLSACNTASGGEIGDTEVLSGLGRAFFYAGARALLVSHWYVESHAAVKLTTGAFAELKRDPAIGRAEALRLAMLAAMADVSRPKNWQPAAHPAIWAPFVVVGEGAK